MANVSLFDVLSAPQLCGMIQGTKTGIPDVFPPGFYQVDKTVEKDYGTYFRVTGTRTTARIAAYGSASQRRELKGVEEVPVKLLHTVENIPLDMSNFMSIFQKTSEGSNLLIDAKGEQEIARQVREFKKNFDNLRTASLSQALFNGAVWYDGAGNLLPSASGAKTTVDFQVPAGNKTQLNWDGNGSIIDTSWDNPAAPIDKHMQILHRVSVRLTGYPIAHAFYGANVASYLTANSKLSAYFVRNAVGNEQYLRTADIPSPLLGVDWHRAYTAFFEDQNGAFQGLIDDDTVVFTPEPSGDWIGWLEGSVPVPTNVQVAADAQAALSNLEIRSGMFGYAQVTLDPVSIKMVAGDTFLPTLKVPKAIFIAKVKF